jgi:hypothetical protein
MEIAGKVMFGIALNYGVHYASMALHNTWCIPHSFTDLLKGLVATASPVCSTLMTIGQTTQNAYGALVTTSAVAIITSGLKNV